MDTVNVAERCVHDLFIAQAERTPHAVALTNGNHSYTYAELDSLTNQLARYLQTQGVGPETIVSCWLHSSFMIVIYILAILKAGGAYLLLDPHLPAQRLRYMVEDAEPLLVLADRAPINAIKDRRIIHTDKVEKEAQLFEESAPKSLVRSDNLVYVAYTSGSTGRPKGALITHAATVNHALAFSKLFQLHPGDRIPILAPFAFDMATEEMIPPLISGCTLVDAPSSSSSLKVFHRSCVAQHYTILNIPAPLWHQWTMYLYDHKISLPPELRLVIVGSDKIYVQTLQEWQALSGADHIQWAAAYGVTEATVTSTFYLTADHDDLHDELLVPIGRPIDNVAVYVLNAAGKPTKPHEVGEIYIGGAGVARGYHHLLDKTKASFVPDTFSKIPGAAMYRTGDLARRRMDGNIVWLGRKDSQIKINGLRIELSEIEAVIHEYPNVSEAIVTFIPSAIPDQPGALKAHIQTKNGKDLDENSLRNFLQSRLPSLMIPKQFVHIDKLPLNANGKVDRTLFQTAGNVSEVR
jgi:amino acid adenylation domain-containing protein